MGERKDLPTPDEFTSMMSSAMAASIMEEAHDAKMYNAGRYPSLCGVKVSFLLAQDEEDEGEKLRPLVRIVMIDSLKHEPTTFYMSPASLKKYADHFTNRYDEFLKWYKTHTGEDYTPPPKRDGSSPISDLIEKLRATPLGDIPEHLS